MWQLRWNRLFGGDGSPLTPRRMASAPTKHPREVTAPSVEDLRVLLADAERRDPLLAPALALAALTGARRAEICGLRWADMESAAGRLVIRQAVVRGQQPGDLVVKETKTGRVRRISLDPLSIAILERHQAACEENATACGTTITEQSFVFSPAPDGSIPHNPENLTAFLSRCRAKVGLPGLRLHHLRHFAATQLIAAGVDVRTVAGRLGHSSPALTLNIYAHFIEDADKEAARKMGELMSKTLPLSQPTTSAMQRSRSRDSLSGLDGEQLHT